MTPLRQRMIEDMRLRNLSANTQRLYVRQVARFAQFFGKSPELLGPEEVRSYQVYLSQQKSASWLTLNQAVGALRFLYRITLGREWALGNIPLPKKPQTLPVVLSQQEVCRFFQNLPNLKHRAMVMTAYATGLRVSEVASLRVTDIDSDRRMIRVRLGKGQKDRYVMLSPHLLELLRAYWKLARPKEWLFPGRPPTRPIARASIHKVCVKAGLAEGRRYGRDHGNRLRGPDRGDPPDRPANRSSNVRGWNPAGSQKRQASITHHHTMPEYREKPGPLTTFVKTGERPSAGLLWNPPLSVRYPCDAVGLSYGRLLEPRTTKTTVQ
jgi:integrase/recombinase XerD